VILLIGVFAGLVAAPTWGGSIQIALQVFFWGVIMRTIYTWHVTWGINSVAHMWGYRNYETREDSRNNWLFALLTNGEGWHNNHHADPRSARHGHRWWELDVTFLSLSLLERIGVIRNLVRPNQSALERKAVA
jgi:stearoyl-CoA desaturase (delta-9 desaturase)